MCHSIYIIWFHDALGRSLSCDASRVGGKDLLCGVLLAWKGEVHQSMVTPPMVPWDFQPSRNPIVKKFSYRPEKVYRRNDPRKVFRTAPKKFFVPPRGLSGNCCFFLQGHHSRIFRTAPEKFFVPPRKSFSYRPGPKMGTAPRQKPEKFQTKNRKSFPHDPGQIPVSPQVLTLMGCQMCCWCEAPAREFIDKGGVVGSLAYMSPAIFR